MNSRRALTFILLSSMFMMSAFILQSVFPPNKPVDADGQVAGLEPGAEAVAPEGSADSDDASDSDGDNTLPDNSPDVANKAAEENVDPPAEQIERTAKDEFVTIGSLAADGSDRYLVTVNKRGGTIRRIEMNFRKKKTGGYKYRDIVWEGGYLGCLDCIDTQSGPTVRVVGPGTPAQLAGVQVGDVIISLAGEPVVSAEGFETSLESTTQPDTDVELVVKRNGEQQTFAIGLTDKPIEVIRPEPGIVDAEFDFPESFIVSLVKPLEQLDKAWPDLDQDMRDSNWEVSQIKSNEIELKFELSPANLAALDIAGPITVFKRYQLPEFSPETLNEVDSRSFHLNLELEIKNGSDQPQKLAFEMDGPTGTTAETWWYANKIHGRQTAIGYIAGARDVIGSNGINPYVFYGGPEIVTGAEKSIPAVEYICDPYENDPAYRQLNFVGVDSQYFNVSVLPVTTEGTPFSCNSVTAYVNNRQGVIPEIPTNARLKKLVDCTFQMVAPAAIAPGESYKQSFEVFVGPKEKELLKHYGLSDARTFGWFSWCSKVLLWLLHLFYTFTFHSSYGLAIIMLTVLVRCAMIPMSRKAALNAQMMQHLQPQMKEIADKHKDDMEKRAAAQRELYQKYKFNPFGGCFMMFFQLPIFYGLYKGLNVDIALRDQPLIPGMQWCSNLSAPDQFLYWKDWMPAALASETGWLGPYFNILPIITMCLFIAQQKLFTPPPTDDQQKMMHKMMTFMMLFMGIMFFKVPAGLCLYFITSSLWGIIERKMLPKPTLDTEKLGFEGANPKASKKLQQAELVNIRKREAEAEERKQRNADRKKRLKRRGS